MNLENVRRVAATMTDSDLRALLNSAAVHRDIFALTGRANDGLGELLLAASAEYQEREDLRAAFAVGCPD